MPTTPNYLSAGLRAAGRIGFLLALTIGGQLARAQVRLPHLVGSGMVLQRDRPVHVWGWAGAGETVSVTLHGQTVRATPAADGKWTAVLAPMPAGGPYSMQITGSNTIHLTDIMVGDVWVCSGQSNMELRMERVKERYTQAIAGSANPAIRHFLVPVRYNFQGPLADVPPGLWEAATPQTVMGFSAVGYFFARDLYEKYHVPIGLIEASVGGSPAQAWLSADALTAFPAYLAAANQVKDSTYVTRIQTDERAATRQWYTRLYQQDTGRQGDTSWADPRYDASAWPAMPLPGYWEDAGVAKGNGVVWFRRTIEVPASMTGKPAKLWLGRIVDADSVFINGRLAGTTGYQYPPRRYELPADLLRPGTNTLVVRVISTAGKGGFVPDKRYELVAGNQTLDLKGLWQYRVGATTGPMPATTFFQYKPGGLFNGMIAPLLPATIKGVIWYQGESNAEKPGEYGPLFSAVIANWRQQWQQTGATPGNFPFLYVQLANFMPATDRPGESQWADLREAQRRTLSVPNTGMAVTADVGEWNDIHPLDKETVGKRLALAAEKTAYGDSRVVASGPQYRSMQRQGHTLVLTFADVGGGLVARRGGPLKHFAIAGADHIFVWAEARIQGNTVVVQSRRVPHPLTVRYAWADNPDGANLYNQEGLPASPFTTDK